MNTEHPVSFILLSNPFPAWIVYSLLLIVTALPPVISMNRSGKKANDSGYSFGIIAACYFTILVFTIFHFSDDRLEFARFPETHSIIWYILWAVLLIFHWFVWFSAMYKGKNPSSMTLPVLLPCLLLLSIGLGQGNLLQITVMCIYTPASILLSKKGVNMI